MAAAKKDEVVTTDDFVQEDATKSGEVKYFTVESPSGSKSEVPESILDALLDSGYKKSK